MIGSTQAELQSWLIETALPFWAVNGVDRNNGGFFEKLDHDGRPVEEMRRARLTARQIYCFAEGHRLGWRGPAEEIVNHGLDFLTQNLLRDDGTVIMAISHDKSRIKDLYDPYDYAFVLFALAAAARKLADFERMSALATKVRQKLVSTWAHPDFGFEEASPRSLPLKSNPQMHLFEAFLAWAELFPGEESQWQRDADSLAALALERLIIPESGALCEFYDGTWQPLTDQGDLLIEPGHQFEWAWLLARWAQIRDHRKAFAAAVRLANLGEVHGTDSKRGIAFNALSGDFSVRDADAKLWPQTERAKAWHILSKHPMGDEALRDSTRDRVETALSGLKSYIFDDGKSPLWREVMQADGRFIDEPVRASSLYHITCAISTVSQTGPENGEY